MEREQRIWRGQRDAFGLQRAKAYAMLAHPCIGRRCPGDAYAGAVAFHHRKQACGGARGKADAAVRGGAPEPAHGIGAMDGVAAVEEDRVRHRRHLVFARVMHPAQALRAEVSARRAVPFTPGGDRPDVALAAFVGDDHFLARKIDLDLHSGAGWRDVRQSGKRENRRRNSLSDHTQNPTNRAHILNLTDRVAAFALKVQLKKP